MNIYLTMEEYFEDGWTRDRVVKAYTTEEAAKKRVERNKANKARLEQLQKEAGLADQLYCWWMEGKEEPQPRHEVRGSNGRYYMSKEDAELAEKVIAFESRPDVKFLKGIITNEVAYRSVELIGAPIPELESEP